MQFNEMKVMGRTLAGWRKEQGYTQQDLSKRVKIDRQTISDIERGKFTGSLAILFRYTNYAGYELSLSSRQNLYPNLDGLAERYGNEDD